MTTDQNTEERLRAIMIETSLEMIREAVRASLKVDKKPELNIRVKAMRDTTNL